MAVVAVVETPENNRGRFLAASIDDAIEELGRHFPIGASVAEKLRRGDVVATDSYRLAIRSLETASKARQQTLF
jgi:hypothetical protein